jgi:uncharacterized protein
MTLDSLPYDPITLAWIALVLLVAGTVKGVVGLGLPTITLALLTATLGLKDAMAILLIPSIVTNVFQMARGGAFRALCRRLWLFLVLLAAGCVLASGAVAVVDAVWLSGLLGVSIVLYAMLGLATPPWPKPGRREIWLSPAVGAVTGLLTGLTGSFVMPSVPYLQALGLPRDHLVQAMGITFMVATLALAVGLGGRGLVSDGTVTVSVLATLPALGGLWIGTCLRGTLSDRLFRKVLFISLVLVGVWIVIKAGTF